MLSWSESQLAELSHSGQREKVEVMGLPTAQDINKQLTLLMYVFFSAILFPHILQMSYFIPLGVHVPPVRNHWHRIIDCNTGY